jgi:hypothetical protein
MGFYVNAEIVPAGFQIEMTDLQCDTDLRNTFRHARSLGVYKLCLLAYGFPVLGVDASAW